MTQSEAAKNFLLSMWLQCRITANQVELAYQLGRITEQERDEILNTPRHCE
mgnify:CR=1 FL=1|jgi:hypothetical protein